jgi:hypothetical protein
MPYGGIEEVPFRTGQFGLRRIPPFEGGVQANAMEEFVVGTPLRLPGGGRAGHGVHHAGAVGVLREPISEPWPRRREGLVSDDERVLLRAHETGAGEARQHRVMGRILAQRLEPDATANG